MQRRRFLAALAVSLPVAGCLSGDSTPGGAPGTEADTPADPGDPTAASPADGGGIPRADAVHTTTVGYFDTCNDYSTTVTIGTGAMFSTETVKTDAYCGDG